MPFYMAKILETLKYRLTRLHVDKDKANQYIQQNREEITEAMQEHLLGYFLDHMAKRIKEQIESNEWKWS